jgi:hypothetical protein
MATSETSICNQALARLGSKRINALTDNSIEAIQARQHYEQTRDALLRSHYWNFAIARSELSPDAASPAFGWEYQYILPSDCLRVLGLRHGEYAIEGQRLLTRADQAKITYVRRVTDPAQFDPLFVEVLVLQLAVKMVMPLAQDKVLRQSLGGELAAVLGGARIINEVESAKDRGGATWNQARRMIRGGSY